MSLLTGEPRSANVVAVEETEVLQIKSDGFKPILESNPDLVETICELIDERKVLLTETENKIEEQNERRKGVMRSIRKFFGLRGSP
jgi:CRP-like cAMP-binding protein